MGVGVGIRDPENHAAASKRPLVCGNNIEPFVFLPRFCVPRNAEHIASIWSLILAGFLAGLVSHRVSWIQANTARTDVWGHCTEALSAVSFCFC